MVALPTIEPPFQAHRYAPAPDTRVRINAVILLRDFELCWGAQISKLKRLTRKWVDQGRKSNEGRSYIVLLPELPRTFVDAITIDYDLGYLIYG